MLRITHPKPGLLERGASLAGIDSAQAFGEWVLALTMDRPLVQLPQGSEERGWDGLAYWAASDAQCSKPVFNPGEVPALPFYVSTQRDGFLAAFSGFHLGFPVARRASRWAILGRIFADIAAAQAQANVALRRAKAELLPEPWVGMPYVEVFACLPSPRTFADAARILSKALEVKPAAIQSLDPVRAWDRKGRSGLDAAAAASACVGDLFPAALAEAAGLDPAMADQRLDAVEPERLLVCLERLLRAIALPVPPSLQAFHEALKDFVWDDEAGSCTAAQVQRQATWMRGLRGSSSRYVPCRVCGFPAFYLGDPSEVAAKAEKGWVTGKILGSGWDPRDPVGATADVPVCTLCRVERLLGEGGVKALGQTPVVLKNLGMTAIPVNDVRAVQHDLARGLGEFVPLPDAENIPPGGVYNLGETGEGSRSSREQALTVAAMRHRFLYPYLKLRSQGHEVAIGFFGVTRGLFGSHVEPTPERLVRERFKLWAAKLPFHGLGGKSRGGPKDLERAEARRRSLLNASDLVIQRTVLDGLREAVMKNDRLLLNATTKTIAILEGHPMPFGNLDLIDEAVAWSEAVVPYLCTMKSLWWTKGGTTKALSEALDNMVATKRDQRVGVAMAALARNLNPYLKKEHAEHADVVLHGIQQRLEKYAELSPSELIRLRNHLAPMVQAAIDGRMVFRPNTQNNFSKRLKRRLLDPAPVEFEEPRAEEATAAPAATAES